MANLLEGGRRMMIAGSFTLKVGAAAAAFVLLLFALGFTDLVLHIPLLVGPPILLLLVVPFWLAVIGGALMISGYVVNGFGMPKQTTFEPTTSSIAPIQSTIV